MTFKKNILATYFSQIYAALVGIVMVPQYIGYMGAEAYGLVGFFVMTQAWFGLLDMGLTPAMLRETARFGGGEGDARSLRRLLRVLEFLFLVIALLGGSAMVIGSDAIATHWLKVEQLPYIEVENSIILIAIICSLRLMSGLYRGVIAGFECLLWLSGFNSLIATARFVAIIPIFLYFGTSPIYFFSYQLVLALLEAVALIFKTYSLLPQANKLEGAYLVWTQLKVVLKFSSAIAFSGFIWILVTQTDKLVLSKMLTLTEYGYFTLAVLVAGGINILSNSMGGAVLPRMTRLVTEGNNEGLLTLYRNMSQFIAVFTIPAVLMLVFFPGEILWAWTGDSSVVNQVAPVLRLYALGNGFVALTAIPYYLQFSKGDLKLHLIGSGLFILLLIPALVWATMHFSILGSGWVWLILNALYFLVWVPRVHDRFFKGLHFKWLCRDLGKIVFFPSIIALLICWLVGFPHDRMLLALTMALMGLLLLLSAAIGSSLAINLFTKKIRGI